MKRIATILLTVAVTTSVMCTSAFAETMTFNGGHIYQAQEGKPGTIKLDITNIDSQARVKMDMKELLTYLDDEQTANDTIYTDEEGKGYSINSIVQDLNNNGGGVPVYYASDLPVITANTPLTVFMTYWKGADITQATFTPKYWSFSDYQANEGKAKVYTTKPEGNYLIAPGTFNAVNKTGRYLVVVHDSGAISNSPLSILCLNVGETPISTPVTTNVNSIKASNIVRLAGENRYNTAVAISQNGWTQSDNVILVDGNNYPDALVGTSYAYLKNAPILTTPSDKLDSFISAEIARLGAKNIYILGNTTSVSQNIQDELSQKYTVVRIGGADIFDTAVKVGEEVRKTNQFDTVALATQGGFADALAIAPFSAKNTMPILFSGIDSLRPDTLQALKDWNIKNVVIVGGTGVVSSGVEDTLKSMGITVTRLAGQDRYDTALEIIKHFAPVDGYKSISICTGENYPDALTGAALSAKNNTPLVLVSKDSVKDTINQYISKNTLDKAYIFGGTAVVSDNVIGN